MQYRQSPPEMVSGESHYFLGQRHQLRVMAYTGPPRIRRSGSDFIDLFVRSGTTVEQRQQVLQGWYRAQLRARIPPLLEQWQPVLGVQAADWGIKQMKTRWGTCNIAARRIWLNLELIKKPVNCLEYVVIHELTHLLERNHNDRFKALMDHHLPHWRLIRQTLNHAP
ncbi:MAG TPA: metal-dependent hydrolase [Gammaproteobacteria bacterium]|nr:metal-dependent hydrolase [Gammaproteobacteria bacterium]